MFPLTKLMRTVSGGFRREEMVQAVTWLSGLPIQFTIWLVNYCKKLSSLQRLLGRHTPTRRSKTANITKDDIILQHIAKMSLCGEVISSFVIFAVLDLRVGGCPP